MTASITLSDLAIASMTWDGQSKSKLFSFYCFDVPEFSTSKLVENGTISLKFLELDLLVTDEIKLFQIGRGS